MGIKQLAHVRSHPGLTALAGTGDHKDGVPPIRLKRRHQPAQGQPAVPLRQVQKLGQDLQNNAGLGSRQYF